MSDLISIDELSLLTGKSKIQLAYLSKLGLIPAAVRRKDKKGELAGHYLPEVVEEVLRIESLRNKGYSYAQISKMDVEKPVDTISEPKFAFNFSPVFAILIFAIGILMGYFLAIFKLAPSSPIDSGKQAVYLITSSTDVKSLPNIKDVALEK